MNRLIYLSVFLFNLVWLNAQQDTVSLSTVNLSDSYLNFAETRNRTIISDSILQRNGNSLTSLLNFNSLIYFKENGMVMVSSPSFRGTTASQTAVIWNGININSRTLGQTDFNTINPTAYDNLIISPGGGSIAYGSGSIGGSIHLNNEIKYGKSFINRVGLAYGDFDTYSADFKTNWSTDKISLGLSLVRVGSDNDYKYPDSNQRNLNGKYYNNSLGMTLGFMINPKNELRFIGNIFDGDRQFSLISPNAIPTKYHDFNTRTMLEWTGKHNRFSSDLKLVSLNENFKYYPYIHSDNYEYGNTENWIAKYDLTYKKRGIYIGWVVDYDYSRVKGSSIWFAKRNTGSVGLFFKHRVFSKVLYEFSARKEVSDSYKSPLLFSLGVIWNPIRFYKLNFNTSKDFRAPTFNDLFWPGSGNPDLNPEISYQFELSHQFSFNHLNFSLNTYYNIVSNLIQWIPYGVISVPENVGMVRIKGIETTLKYSKTFDQHHLELNFSYAYTRSENQKLKKQLAYVPFHKMNFSFAYNYKQLSVYWQTMYNGSVYTDSKNTKELNDYWISNLGIDLSPSKKRNYSLGVQLRNVFNKFYQNVTNRWMPGRNYNVYINLKF